MTTLLYGGSFNPITLAHILCAREAMERGKFSQVIFIPCGDAPHKADLVSFEHRLAMLKLAIGGHVGFGLETIEGEWAKQGQKSYTINTYRHLKRVLGDVSWLIGSDNIPQIRSWYDFPAIREEMKFIVVPRPNYGTNDLDEQMIGLRINTKEVYAPLLEISSTYIRERIKSGKTISYLVPDAVEKYIKQNGLYK